MALGGSRSYFAEDATGDNGSSVMRHSLPGAKGLASLRGPPGASLKAVIESPAFASYRAVSTLCRPLQRSTHGVSLRSIALSVMIILRITATMTTFGFFPVAARRLWKALSAGLQRMAIRAALLSTRRMDARPPQIQRAPLSLPLSKA